MELPPTLLPESPSFLPIEQLRHVFAPGRRRPCLFTFCNPRKASRDLEKEEDTVENGTESLNNTNRSLSLLPNKDPPSAGVPRSIVVLLESPRRRTTKTSRQADTHHKSSASLLAGFLLVAIAFSGFQPTSYGGPFYHHPCYSTYTNTILRRVTRVHDNHRMVCHNKTRQSETFRRQRALRELWNNLENAEGRWFLHC